MSILGKNKIDTKSEDRARFKIRLLAKNRINQIIALMLAVLVLINIFIARPIKNKIQDTKNMIKETQLAEENLGLNNYSGRIKYKNLGEDINFYKLISNNRSLCSMEVKEVDRNVLYKIKFNKDKLDFKDFIINLKTYGKSVCIHRVSYGDGVYDIEIYKK